MRTTIFSTLVLILLSACYTTERNCKPFQTGTFTFYTVVDGDTLTSRFVRNDSIEIDYFAGIADTANVRWVSDCECIVTKRNPLTSNVQRGRVTKVLD
jgi:hypothetical protein